MENTYVKFEAPESLVKDALDFVENSYRSGKIKKGTNEVVKSIERGEAKVVVIAEDVSPPEVVFYLPVLCDERKVPYTYVKNKNDLGLKVGIASAASIAVVDYGKNEDAYKDLISSIENAKSGKEEKKKPAAKSEQPKEEEIEAEATKAPKEPKKAPVKEKASESKEPKKKEKTSEPKEKKAPVKEKASEPKEKKEPVKEKASESKEPKKEEKKEKASESKEPKKKEKASEPKKAAKKKEDSEESEE
jgi:large subunit ribosomal protein L7Ae